MDLEDNLIKFIGSYVKAMKVYVKVVCSIKKSCKFHYL